MATNVSKHRIVPLKVANGQVVRLTKDGRLARIHDDNPMGIYAIVVDGNGNATIADRYRMETVSDDEAARFIAMTAMGIGS
jgi:hypothetical protein